MPTATPFAELLRERALSRMLKIRVRAAPIVGALALGLAALSPTPLRLILFGGAALSLVLIAWLEGRQKAPSDLRLKLNLGAMSLLQLVVVFAAGGVAGPVLPVTMVFALIASILLRPREALVLVLGVQIPVVWACTLVHVTGVLPELWVPAYAGLYEPAGTPGPGPYLGAGLDSLMLVAAHFLGRYLRRIVGDLGAELAGDRANALAQNDEAVRTIQSLSGEIAHELKNPLASIKGLTALVSKDVEGVPAERMNVLRREVDRMQSILDEFLTYSRPLVPLTLERNDLRELAADVVALHEGMAAERNVRLELAEGPAVETQCDPRKVRQVVINLLQNAIHASKAGQSVRIEVRERGEVFELSVRDHGAGIAEEVLPRLFSVGMTTKENGSGLGLVVARGLARQHGGELTLGNASGGGALATLALPAEPPSAPV